MFHMVYTPIPSLTLGGHFFLWDALHVTLVSRALDHLNGMLFTNQDHEHTDETLWRMAAMLPRLPQEEIASKYI